MTEILRSQTIFVLTGNLIGKVEKVARMNGGYIIVVVVTPEPTDPKIVEGAWSYAVQHTPKELNQADYERARNLLQKRYPSWQVFGDNGVPHIIRHDQSFIVNDKPEVDIRD